MSPTVEWATIAVSGYMREDRRPRVVIPLLVGAAFVLDQHDEQACNLLGIDREESNQSWRPALEHDRSAVNRGIPARLQM
jgi:hypothetical protein